MLGLLVFLTTLTLPLQCGPGLTPNCTNEACLVQDKTTPVVTLLQVVNERSSARQCKQDGVTACREVETDLRLLRSPRRRPGGPRGGAGGDNGAVEGSAGDLSWEPRPGLPAVGCRGGEHAGRRFRLHFWLHQAGGGFGPLHTAVHWSSAGSGATSSRRGRPTTSTTSSSNPCAYFYQVKKMPILRKYNTCRYAIVYSLYDM